MSKPPPLADPATAIDEPAERIRGVIDAMRQSPAQPWSLDDLADMACYSRYHFARLFTSTTGIAPGVFQASLRFAEARRLLLTTDAPVTDICAAAGYQGLGTFTTRFRRLVGLNPGALRDLPHRLAEQWLTNEQISVRGPGRGAIRILLEPDAGNVDQPRLDSIYVGLFTSFQPAGRPIAGVWTRHAGVVTIAGVPEGPFCILAAAFPVPIDGIGHLLDTGGLRVGSAGPVHAASHGGIARPVTLRLAAPGPLSPPILIALPALISDLTQTSRRHVVAALPYR